MLTKLIVKNFKGLENVEIPLDNAVVFVGPNNSGKTSALQAISLWEIGMHKWVENRLDSNAKQRTGVSINRKDLFTMPVSTANQIWKNLRVRESIKDENGNYRPKNIMIEIIVEGFTNNQQWELGFEFYYANPESFYCRRIMDDDNFPKVALEERIGFLPPMSRLATEEDMLQKGSIQVRIGEGKTAEVLRNLCWIIWNEKKENWKLLTDRLEKLFGIHINPPEYNQLTGKISMSYNESSKNEMNLINSGSGFQQVLLLFSYIYSSENTILLLDEPDAHLEILRQKQIYNILSDTVQDENSQLIIATHSEVILNEAAEKDEIIAFLGNPHPVNDKQQLVKSLTTLGFDQYLLAKQKKWVLYLEGSTDLSMLKSFASVLHHPVQKYLESPFVKYTTNNPRDARNHFYGLKECVPDLNGIAIFDRLEQQLDHEGHLVEIMWQRREIENYLPIPQVIYRYIEKQPLNLFNQNKRKVMEQLITDYIPPAALKDNFEDWWINAKISDDFLNKIFREYFKKFNMPQSLMDKRKYYRLADLANPGELDYEITQKLNSILDIAQKSEK